MGQKGIKKWVQKGIKKWGPKKDQKWGLKMIQKWGPKRVQKWTLNNYNFVLNYRGECPIYRLFIETA